MTIEVYAKDLKIGDKVNCKMDGWLTVEKIDNTYIQSVYVTYIDEKGKHKDKHYYKYSKLWVTR